MKKNLILILISAFGLSSCWQEIDTVKRDPLETITVVNNIQKTQAYYKIEDNEITLVDSINPKSWDLGFETGENGQHIIINYSAAAQIINTGIADINDVDINTVNNLFNSENWKFDHNNGHLDSTALGNWIDTAMVYILYRGGVFDNEVAYYKIFFESVNSNEYVIKYADINFSDQIITKTITKNNSVNFVTFSLTLGETKLTDPGKQEWDLLFTPYYGWYETLTPGYFLPYYMSGVYINYLNGVEVIEIDDSGVDYDNIDITYIDMYNFSGIQDVIGQDWKLLPDPDNPFYFMDENKKYIIHAVNGNYYKLRFISFYNEKGEKAYPVFQYNKL
ncbi:MAG: HmuY family protein [Bacteroidales bacterium]|nr:HmuY family protein [Bacteroidales bacterium]